MIYKDEKLIRNEFLMLKLVMHRFADKSTT